MMMMMMIIIIIIHSEKFFLLQIKFTLLRKQPILDLSPKFKALQKCRITRKDHLTGVF